MGKKPCKFLRKKPGDKELDWQWRRLRSGRRYDTAALPATWLEDSLAQARAETATHTSATATSASPSYFLCHDCSEDIEEREPVITFCGHVFCWSCLHRLIAPDGVSRLRGECPTCQSAVDLCPRTKTVCAIYHVERPQAVPANCQEMTISEKAEIDSKGKCKIEDDRDSKRGDNQGAENEIDDDDDTKSEMVKERLEGFIKLDPRKRPSDKKPNVHSSFINFANQDGDEVKDVLISHMFCLFSRWKSVRAELNDIIQKIQSLGEQLSSGLVKEHDRGVQAVAELLNEMPVKIQRTNSQSSCVGVDMSTVLTEEINRSSSPSDCSSSHYFYCNCCCGNATFRKPIITYCGHVFCWPCFRDDILRRGFLECPVCKSAVDASTACPISGNEEADENQDCKILEEWQKSVLILNPSAAQLQIHSMIYDLDHKIALHTENFYDTILKVLHVIEDFGAGMEKHLVDNYTSFLEYDILKFFPKEEFGQVLDKANRNSSTISSIPSQIIHNETSLTSTSSSSASRFCCGCCCKATLNDPVVTYCTHLFCWHCLYADITTNGTHDEDGSLHGPCPVCRADTVVFSRTSSKLTIIPICKGPESILQARQKIEEEDSTGEVPLWPIAKRLSIQGLKKMRNCLFGTMRTIKCLTNSLQLKMDKNEKIICSTYQLLRRQRHRLLLGLLDGWRWAYLGDLMPGIVGTDNAETRLASLSRSWVDVVDVDSACMLSDKEKVLVKDAVLL